VVQGLGLTTGIAMDRYIMGSVMLAVNIVNSRRRHKMKCKTCDKTAKDTYRALAPKYSADTVI
jgi:hypothetical protein